MRRRSERHVLHLPLEIFASGRKHAAELEDLSRTGMFLRVPDLPAMPNGTVIHVALMDGPQRFVTSATVAHSLDEADARALGRRTGIGVELRAPTRPNDRLFSIAIDRLLARHGKPADESEARCPAPRRIVVATSHVRLLERLSAAFGDAGFVVGTAANGIEAIAACLRARPDVLLVECVLPIVDGLDVVEHLAKHPRLAGMPIIVMSEDPRDGIAAFERGALDFVAKPFAADELVLRARRLSHLRGDVVFRGELAEIGLPALLTMFEHERKSGRLVLSRADHEVVIELEAGRVVHAHATTSSADPHGVLMDVLDWAEGRFELVRGTVSVTPCELAMPITHLLLEHARRRDEGARRCAM